MEDERINWESRCLEIMSAMKIGGLQRSSFKAICTDYLKDGIVITLADLDRHGKYVISIRPELEISASKNSSSNVDLKIA